MINILTTIEPVYDGEQTAVKQYKVIAQDSSFPYTLFYGTYEECVEFEKDYDLEQIRLLLSSMPGVIVFDDIKNLKYPMPMDAHDKDAVFVGRLRRDETQDKTLNMWIVSDNLRKGAATNAVQIAEVVKKFY